jgi:glycosyltransferase involved in cell wall biosynthesis
MDCPDALGKGNGGGFGTTAQECGLATTGRGRFSSPAQSESVLFERSRDAIAWDREIVSELVSVVIPTLNEAENLRCVIPELSRRYELIVVDGGSSDETVDVARALRHDTIVVQQTGRGKGDALLCGFRAASGQIIVTFDGDGSARADEIPRFVKALDDADFAKGSRFVDGGGSADLTRVRRIGNRFLCGLVNLLHRTAYTDLCYGFNAFRRSCLPFMPDGAPGFEIETVVNIRIARADLRVVEVPSYEDLRYFGESNLHPFRDGFKILRVLIRERFRSKRWLQAAAERSPMPEPAKRASSPEPAELVPVPEPALAPISD